MFSLSENILRKLGAPIPNKQSGDEGSDALDYNDDVLETLYLKADHRVLFSTFMHFWFKGERSKALTEITKFLNNNKIPKSSPINDGQLKSELEDVKMFRVHCLLKQADFMRELKEGSVTELLATLTEAKELAGDQYSVWHAWAVANYDQLKKADAKDSTPIPAIAPAVPLPFLAQPQHSRTPSKQTHYSASAALGKLSNFAAPRKGSASIVNLLSIQQVDSVTQHVVEGIKGFVRSIILGEGQPVANILQDTLQLLTLWFSYGTKKGVYQILESELDKILPQNWLSVIPQLIARIHVKSPEISGLLRRLLVKVAVKHPQALVCPIFVALNTNDIQQKLVAAAVLQEVRKLQPTLVEEATMVSRELMRVAITPHELWYDGLEQAAQQYMDGSNLHSMLSTLSDLHEAMNEGTTNIRSSRRMEEGFSEGIGKIGNTTLRDISFRHNYSQSLYEAQCWLEQYKKTERTADLHQAWEIYQLLFKKIKVQISTLKKIELEHISPALTKASNLSLAIPGSYRPSAPVVSIRGFSSTIQVISSKQRPRRVALLGSDGKTYPFLLKGHEDLRQDERVMQLFGLINVCLDNDRTTSNRSLGIVRYSVLPLSNNSGLIGWVQNCDTMNQLIKQYREAKNVRLLLEAKLQQAKCQNYDKLPLMHKVEIFKKVHEECTGQDLAKMLWLRSKSSDVWIERRDNFTKSLAVMSMAGYILGLGDRHPSNLMIERVTGNVVHIDFGDCFEITAQRSRYPEIIPFRLTRMLINCMEASGIEGTYRLTAERVSFCCALSHLSILLP